MSHLQPQKVPVYAKSRYLDRATVSVQRNKCSMDSLAVDPVLLHAKLEAVKHEQDSARRQDRQQRRVREQMHSAEPRRPLQESRDVEGFKQKELLQQSSLLVPEWTADGKPCFDTARILAALETVAPKQQKSNDCNSAPEDSTKKRSDREMSPGGSNDDDEVSALKSSKKSRRRFKSAEAGTKLVAIKHGSQTTYERVDEPSGEIFQDAELLQPIEHESVTRPRLSGYDRPHWAQQSQNASHMHLFRRTAPGIGHVGARPQAQVAAAPVMNDSASRERQDSLTSGSLIADAVKEIRKEQRLKKLQSVSNLFKRASRTSRT